MKTFQAFRIRLPIALLALIVGARVTSAVPRAQGAGVTPLRAPVASPVDTAKVVQWLREHFHFRDNMKVKIEPFRNSKLPGFVETTILVDDGREDTSQTVYMTKDGAYIALGALYAVGTDPKTEILKYARENYRVPETTKLTAGPLVDSKYAAFQQVNVLSSAGKSQVFLVTRNTHVLVLGHVLPLDAKGIKGE